MNLRDLTRLRSSLALLAVFAALGGACAVAALRFVSEKTEALQAAEQQRSEAASRLARAETEAGTILRKLDLYRALAERAHDGGEYRPVWLRRLAEAKRKRRIFALHYELSPRRPFDFPAADRQEPAAHALMASTMKVRMELRHEEDLLGFIRDLAQDVRALVQARHCDVARREGALQAECTFEWITLGPRS